MDRHPAQRFSVLHHDDLAAAVELALAGRFDGVTVNLADDAPLSVQDMADLTGFAYPTSSAPLVNPWQAQVDTSLATRLGFHPRILTARQAVRDGSV